METPPNDKAQKRARLGLLFGLIWLFISLTALSWIWLSNGPLEPLLPRRLSPAGAALDRIISTITPIAFILWLVSGGACLIIAIPASKHPRASVSILLSLTLLLITIPALFVLPWIWSPTMSGDNWARERFLVLGVLILFVGMNLACVKNAFYDGPSPEYWQGKTAVFLSVLVAVINVPFSLFMLYLFFQLEF